jgi:hypothetical protein
MKYFAQLGLNSRVINVVQMEDALAPNEAAGIKYLSSVNNNYPFWKQTFTDGTRKNKAATGMTYDEDKNGFIQKKPPFASWTLNEDTCCWEAPVAKPDDEKMYNWNEETTSWEEVT